MLELLRNKPFVVALLAGGVAQFLKVLSFLIAEKRLNYKRFVQPDGMPNMHSAAMSALTVAVGFRDGFDSLVFALSACLVAIVVVDTMNVKNATSRQAEAVLLILDRLRKRKHVPVTNKRGGLSYTPVDVFSGLAVGVAFALLIF